MLFRSVIPFWDDSDLLSYFHMIENGHKILASINPTKKITLSTHKIFKGQFILTFYRGSYLFIFGKTSLDYFGRMIADLLRGLFENVYLNTSEDI